MKRNGSNPVICLLISTCLIFAFYNSTAVLLLSLCGATTLGTLTSYDTYLYDSNASTNRSRTVVKGYRFNVRGKEYKGHVTYRSDEAWPCLKDGETRTERITYLSAFPAINKPAHLVDCRALGVGGFFFHILSIPGSLFLFLLASGRLGTRGRRIKRKATRK